MKRKIYLLLLAAFLFVCFSVSTGTKYVKNTEVQTISGDKTDLKSFNYKKVTYLCLKELKDSVPNGWTWRQKAVTKKEDIKLIIDFLNSIDYKGITKEAVNGFGQIIELKTDIGYTFVFSGNRVNVNGTYFGIKNSDDEELKKIYETLPYNEEPSKPN